MALVQCPECNKENISNAAEACPNCGFTIKKHFDRIQREQEAVEKSKEKEHLRIESERKEMERRESTIKRVYRPDKPSLSVGGILIFLVSLSLGILEIWAVFDGAEQSFMILLGSIIMFIITYFSLKYVIVSFKHKKEMYQLSLNNFEQYQRKYFEEQENAAKMKEQMKIQLEEANQKKKGYVPSCPNCMSKNTSRISALSRTASAELFGLASSSLGKQYACLSCKHKW